MPVKAKVFQFSFYIFCLFPLLIKLPLKSGVVILFVVIQAIIAFGNKEKSMSSGLWFPFLQVLPVLFLAISLLYTSNIQFGLKQLETSLLLVVLPWVLYMNRNKLIPEIRTNVLLFYSLVFTIFTAFLIVVLIASGIAEASYKLPKSYYYIRTFLESFSGLHPTYFSLMGAIALLVFQFELRKGIHKFYIKVFCIISAIIILTGLILASSKMILFATFLGSLIIWSQGLNLRNLLIRLVGALIVLSVLVVMVKPLNQRVSELFSALTEKDVSQDNPDSMRKAIYKGTFSVIADNFWSGVGVGDSQDELVLKYKTNDYSLAAEKGFNTHNHYLHIWVSAGFIPFLLFVFLQLVQVFIALVNKCRLHLTIVLLFSLSMLTENILSRQDGVFLYAFFSSFLVYSAWKKSENCVYLNGRFLSQKITGVQRFAHEISKFLVSELSGFTIVSPVKKSQYDNRIVLPLFNGAIWEQITLPVYLKLLGSPKLVNFCNAAPIFYKNQYVTLHDVAFMENSNWFSEKFVRWYKFMIPKVLTRSIHVFTVSQFSMKEIVKYFKVDPQNITVVQNGIPEIITDVSSSYKPLIKEQYVLSVGTISTRKNQEQLVDAYLSWKECPFKLVLIGKFDDAVFSSNPALQRKINNSERIILITDPSDDELNNLYSNAIFTVYISLYEGFGLPVLESLAFKKPVLASDIPVFRELFAKQLFFVGLDNNDNIRAKLEEMLNSVDFWTNKIESRNELSSNFSYELSAKQIESVIKKSNV